MAYTVQAYEKLPSIPASPRGVGVESNELLYTQEQSYRKFYRNSEVIQTYFGQRSVAETIYKLRSISSEPLFKIISEINSEIDELQTWETGSYSCPAPSHNTIELAKNWVTRLYFQVASGNWVNPNITSGSQGEVVFEWWYEAKKLTIYVSSEKVEYLQVWGTDIHEDMSDGNAESIETCMMLWTWLRS
jgi:hypothetical protein